MAFRTFLLDEIATPHTTKTVSKRSKMAPLLINVRHLTRSKNNETLDDKTDPPTFATREQRHHFPFRELNL